MASVESKQPRAPTSTSGTQDMTAADVVVEGKGGEEPSALEKHVAFFDRNNDGLIYPWETFQGFRAIGCGILLSSAASLIINMSLSRKTRPGKGISLLFPIEIKNIALAKHGSDSGVYDSHGRFVASKFDEIFSKHARTKPDAVSGEELDEMLKANREPNDKQGWIAAFVEWKILYVLCKDKDGFLHQDTLRAAYDGSLFYQMEKEEQQSSLKKKE